jgi:hypothetical protein
MILFFVMQSDIFFRAHCRMLLYDLLNCEFTTNQLIHTFLFRPYSASSLKEGDVMMNFFVAGK